MKSMSSAFREILLIRQSGHLGFETMQTSLPSGLSTHGGTIPVSPDFVDLIDWLDEKSFPPSVLGISSQKWKGWQARGRSGNLRVRRGAIVALCHALQVWPANRLPGITPEAGASINGWLQIRFPDIHIENDPVIDLNEFRSRRQVEAFTQRAGLSASHDPPGAVSLSLSAEHVFTPRMFADLAGVDAISTFRPDCDFSNTRILRDRDEKSQWIRQRMQSAQREIRVVA